MLSGAGVTLAPHWLLLLSSLPKGVANTSHGGQWVLAAPSP